jgi:hypothetical protein
MAKKLGKKFGVNYTKTPFREFVIGLKTELEHIDILAGNYEVLTKIVMAHLRENPRYYYFLEKAGL